jgi:molybdate transport system ATP-binding protein
MPQHRLSVRGELGAIALDVAVELTAPWTVLFGPSGSGKSTLLRSASGLLGHADNTSLSQSLFRQTPHSDNPAWHDLTHLPAHRRRIAYAPQRASLFPHLTVRRNIAFANSLLPRSAQAPGRKLFDEAVELFQLAALLHRLPASLSGGESQRVSLARAFAVPNAQWVLLDEPVNGLDREVRNGILRGLKTAFAARSLPVLSVTHDLEETLLLDAEVLVMHSGSVTRQGRAAEVLAAERASLLENLT